MSRRAAARRAVATLLAAGGLVGLVGLAVGASAAGPDESPPPATAARECANDARTAVTDGRPEAAAAVARADTASEALGLATRSAVETRLHVLRTRMLWLQAQETPPAAAHEALVRDLAKLEAAARAIEAHGPLAFALLYEATLLEESGRPQESERARQRGLALAERPDTREALARIHALRGGWLEEQGREPEAIAALRRAVRLVGRQRGRIPAGDFLELARPIHEQLAGLLLQASARDPGAEQALLREALDALEELKVAELREYFGDQCLLMLEETTPELVPDTLLLYPVLRGERVELIVGRGGRLERIAAPIGTAELHAASRRLRGRLQDPTGPGYRAPATRLYDALIRPLGEDALTAEVTLTFVPSGALREIPLAALYDAQTKQFLIEQVAISTLPSLRIIQPEPIDPRRARMLLVGLTKGIEGLAPLPSVKREIAAAGEHFPSEQRIDAAFTKRGFEEALERRAYDIVHIASHGRFDTQASESYLQTYDGRLTLPELAEIVARTRHRTSRPIELLALSACETAIGDDRAVLGLAGVAVQSGARSAIATLWRVNDAAAAELFASFYAKLAAPGQSRSRALQQAQIALIEDERFRHPIHWSAFLLINSWL